MIGIDNLSCLTLACVALPCQTFLRQVSPLRVPPDLVVLNLTLLSSLSRSVLLSLTNLNAALAGFASSGNARLDFAQRRILRCLV